MKKISTTLAVVALSAAATAPAVAQQANDPFVSSQQAQNARGELIAPSTAAGVTAGALTLGLVLSGGSSSSSSSSSSSASGS